ncbi:MAG: Gfo/Idh/MocA family oxidoreductase [Desulfovibrionaceae bacterium]|jgi:predicted dehydrogenase|nr:Gfo/Idh/MocA family oxidoreductase [Desulfovibrionaceae bacterium]
MNAPLRTILVGFGQIAAGLAQDARMAAYFPYATHAQALRDHPGFDWAAVADPRPEALEQARRAWNVPEAVADLGALADPRAFEVAVLATPPGARIAALERLPGLRAVFVEKPLGQDVAEAERFLALCRERSILVQVNYWRRGDENFRALADGGLAKRIGRPRACFGLYGNGLKNNGSHLIDFVAMLLGEVAEAAPFCPDSAFAEGPIPGDLNVPFTLRLADGPPVAVQPVRFADYREVGLDIWAERGRMTLYQESLRLCTYPRVENRGLEREYEIATDRPECVEPTCGQALLRMYGNLFDAVRAGAALWSTGDRALHTQRLVQSVLLAAARPTEAA